MNEKEKKLREERAGLVKDMRATLDKAEKENRTLDGTEEDTYQRQEARVGAIEVELQDIKKDGDRRSFLTSHEEELRTVQTPMITPEPQRRTFVSEADETREFLARFEQDGRRALKGEEYDKLQSVIFTRYLMYGGNAGLTPTEKRALQGDADIYGGYIVTPEQFVLGLIKALDASVFVRQRATKFTVATAASLGQASLDNDPADPAWTAEIGSISEDSTMSFGKRELHPHALAKLIKVAEKLLRLTANGAESLVRERLQYKFEVTEESAFLTGSGAQQPLGLFTASDNGISTSYDVSTDNTTTAFTADGLINCKFTVKSKYWPNCSWIFHQDAVKMLRQLKDGEGQYIWHEGLLVDEPDILLGKPIDISEFAPNTFTNGLYVGLFGDLSYYHIADALDMRVQRLNELYAATNQVGFIGRKETDGMPVLGEAFARVTLA